MNQIRRIGRTVDACVPFPKRGSRGRTNRPNIVYWVIEDAGFGKFSPYGG